MTYRWLLAGAFVALMVLVFSACGGGGQGSSSEEIKVGAVFPLSGDLAFSGERGLQGVRLAAELINEDGGIDGKKIRVVQADAPNPSAAQSAVKQLVTREGVKIIVGSTSSAISAVAAPTAERLGALFWETSAIADSVTESGYTNVFRTITTASGQGSFAGEFVATELSDRLGVGTSDLRVALLYTDDEFGTSISNAERRALKEAGAQIVMDTSYTAASTKDFTSTILQMKNKQVDVVIQAGQLPDSLLFWRQARQQNLNLKAGVGTGSGYAEAGFAETLGQYSNGIFNVVPPTPQSINMDNQSESARKLYERYVDAAKEHNYEETSNMDWAFMGAWVLFHDVLPKAESTEVQDIVAAAQRVEIPAEDTVTGYGVKFAENGQNIRAFPVVQQWQDQQLRVVYPRDLAVADFVNTPLSPWSERS
jgi:branched-chain amino acid transport system substrate-binding protein